ncbi:MAG: glycosyltransferase [Paludisphaera borealis]|uniref:glycosyltransferase n=1 Tax=Paludisphaera borealis TaxID=1387353 RepID=UPI0028430556|nr:glycosyltransferase [Paludisphaera borealis]MDR3620553.1 glycosyltransferase [Paludisphaera borealis]
MHVLFIHDAFPAQFGRLALELTKRHGWRCSFLVETLSSCPTPTAEMLEAVELHQIPPAADGPARDETPWPQVHGRFLEQSASVFDALRARPALRPDLVVAHGGRGAPSVFLRDVVDCPIVTYCEYYFATRRRDISYRVDLPPAEPAPFFPRCINAPTLLGLVDCDAGYSPTAWQKQSFPERFHSKIEVHFDGVDAELYAPGAKIKAIDDISIPPATKVVTFVSRGLESVRGFDVFMKVADRIARRRSDVLFVVVGGDETHYGWDKLHTGSPSFKQWVLDGGSYDLSRFLFLGRIAPERLAEILRRTDLHIYLSTPFVTSWSLFNAMSSGAVVLASDVEPVRELIEPGVNGLVGPLFDVDRLTETALRVLDDPATHAPLGRAARRTIEEKYSVDVCIPPLRDFFSRMSDRSRISP